MIKMFILKATYYWSWISWYT